MKPKTQNISELIGLTLSKATGKIGDDEICFESVCGRKFRLYHQQDCCEFVRVEDICGEMSDLVGSPITQAEENSNSKDELPHRVLMEYDNSFTWTFYRLATAKGQVVIRWLGESNGYYSEAVDFEETA